MYIYRKSNSTCVSARDVPVMMGLSPFQTRAELLIEKCNWRKKKPFTESMKRGVVLEPEALSEFCKMKNIDINDIQKPGFTRHENLYHVGGVPDGIYDNTLIEIKCPGRFTLEKKPAEFYIQQMQVYMQIFNLDNGLYVEYIVGEPLNIIEVHRDNTWWNWVTPIIKSFWDEVSYWRNGDITKYPKFESDFLYESISVG